MITRISGSVHLRIRVGSSGRLPGVGKLFGGESAYGETTGHAVASLAVSKWEGELNSDRAVKVLNNVAIVEEEEPEQGVVDPHAAVPDEA